MTERRFAGDAVAVVPVDGGGGRLMATVVSDIAITQRVPPRRFQVVELAAAHRPKESPDAHR